MRNILQSLYVAWAVLVFCGLLAFSLPLLAIASLFNKPTDGRLIFYVLKGYAELLSFFIGVRKKVYFRPKKNRPHDVLAPNHSSYFDGVAIYLGSNRPFKTLGKTEILRIPIFGYLYKKAVILVDRSSAESKTKAFNDMNEELNDLDVLVFPQGTFHYHTIFEAPVYSGAFKLADMHQARIQPILYLDTQRIFPDKAFKKLSPGPCRIVYLPPIKYDIIHKHGIEKMKKLYTDYMLASLDFIQNNDIEGVYDYSSRWLENNT